MSAAQKFDELMNGHKIGGVREKLKVGRHALKNIV